MSEYKRTPEERSNLKAMEILRKERERKRELGIGGRYTFKHLGHEIVKFDSYTRGSNGKVRC